MNFNIDIAIVVGFLIVNLAVGLYFGRGVNNIKDYALGGRNFNTNTLIATLVATWIGGSSLAIKVSESYNRGLYYISTGIFELLSFLIVAYILAPRMKEFLGSASIAEAMGRMYGKNVRIITAISGVVGTVGFISVQFKVSAGLFSYFTGIDALHTTLASAVIVIIYSSYSGIKAVTFTDIVQLFAFCIFVPGLALLVWGTLDAPTVILDTLNTNPNFDLSMILDPENAKFYSWIALLFFFLIPSLDPAAFQRIAMSKDIQQVQTLFSRSACIYIIIAICMYWIGILLLSSNQNLGTNQLISYTIQKYSYPGLIGLTLVGIIAMVMSTADSYINSSSVLISNDIFSQLNLKFVKGNEILIARVAAVIIGIVAIAPAIFFQGLLDLIIFTFSFYMPIVTPAFILGVLGFRSSGKSVIIGMCAGFITVLVISLSFESVNSIAPGVFANIFFLFSSHYFLRQPGGWVGVADKASFNNFIEQRKLNRKRFFKRITSFKFLEFCSKNSPVRDSNFTLTGIFIIIAVFSSMYSMPIEVRTQYSLIVEAIYHTVLFVAAVFLIYPVLPNYFRKNSFESIIWISGLFYTLIFVSCLLLIISNFEEFQLMIFLLSTVVLSMLVRWQLSLVLIISGIYLSIKFFEWFAGTNMDPDGFGTLQFKIMYTSLLVSSVLIAFFKPKQEHQEATEAKVDTLETEVLDLNEKVVHYSERISDQEKEIERLGATAQRIINNVNHELRLPVGNVMNFAEMLNDGLGKFNEQQLKSLSDEVYKNSNRLSSMIMNMLDLATLNAKKLELDKKMINLGELVEDRINNCRKIYLDDKKIDFVMKIHPEILILVDPNYMRQVVDNLVINAIKFSAEGVIRVELLKKGGLIEFTIKDNGIGIPKEELYDIFTPFKMGSNTESKAEGRGVGLALCKAAIEAHSGTITAESSGVGAVFRFVLK